MTQRSLLQAQILEKLAAPLVAAVSSRSPAGSDDLKGDAVRTAELLGKAVQLGTLVVGQLDVKGSDADSEAVRVMVTVTAGHLVADYYRHSGKVPNDNDVARLGKSLEATLMFSDNFVASGETVDGVGEIMSETRFFQEENRRTVQFINVLCPLINAVSAFSFGKAENTLVQEIADRLTACAASLRSEAFGSDDKSEEAAFAELAFLKGLVCVYTESYKEAVESLKLAGVQSQDPAGALEAVWESFEKKRAMLSLLSGHIMPSAGGAATGVVSPAGQASVPEASISEEPEAPQEEKTPPVQQAGNPMAFFKPNTEEGEGA